MYGKTLITGTGRSGTSFTMQVFTALGLDTGFDTPTHAYFRDRMAGQERIIPPDADAETWAMLPGIVKDPRLVHTLRGFLDAGHPPPGHVYVLVRDVRDAAQSRVDREMLWDPAQFNDRPVFADAPLEERLAAQTEVLYAGLGRLLETLALYEVPHTLVQFPRLALDSSYFARAFRGVLVGVDPQYVLAAHARLMEPSALHYGVADQSAA